MIKVKKILYEDNLEEIAVAIDASAWTENSEINSSDYSINHIKKSLEQSNHLFCVAYDKEQFAGIASAFILTKPDGDIWLYVNEVDVVSEKQRLGVGTELMKFLETEAAKVGAVEMWLGTEKDNISANALYKSLRPDEIEDFVGYNYKIHNGE